MNVKNQLKKTIGWLHLWLGLAAGLIIMVVALTGSLLSFEDELELILFKQRHIVALSGSRLPADSLVSIASQLFPGKKVNRLLIEPEADHSIEVRIGNKGKQLKVAYLDPYSGRVLYQGDYNKQFFQQVRSLHRYLLLDKAGKVITGISCACCFFLVISGLVIWWPANRLAMKQRFRIKWDAKGKRLNWDLHAVTGFYLSIFLLAITLTGLVWSYGWVENLLYKVAGSKPQKEINIKNLTQQKKVTPGAYQMMLNQLNKLYPEEGTIAFAFGGKGAITLQKERVGSAMRQTDAAYFDSKTGQLVSTLPFSKLNAGTKVRRMILPLHTGSLLGWPTKLLACLVGLFTASLPVTGILIWLGKNKKSKNANRRRRVTSSIA